MWSFAAIRISIPPALVEFANHIAPGRAASVPLVIMVLALLLVGMPTPPISGLDGSWSMVLVYANRHGLQFRGDIAFTYDPCGFNRTGLFSRASEPFL
jgi:hypothetical protein